MTLIGILLSNSTTLSQNVVNIKHFSSAVGITVNGEPIRKLYKASLSTGNVDLVCDSAWQFLRKNELHAFGNIQIDTQTEHIWTDTLYYYTDKDASLLRGRVIILQDSTTLFGNKVDYNFLTKTAWFQDEIRLEDPDGILKALKGTYFQNQDSAIFRGEVQLADSAQYAEGDSLFINRESKYLQFYSNIFVADSTNNALLIGNYLEADSTGRRYVRGNAYLRRTESDSAATDTTHINAQEILLLDQDSTTIIHGYDDVSVWSVNFSSLSDTLYYNSKVEQFELTGHPKAWHKNIQLTGPYISVQLDSNTVRELKSYIKPIAVQEDSVTERLNQLKGDTLIATFAEGNISRIDLFPDSKILYHTKNEEDKPDGAMENSSPKTILYFAEGELTKVWMGQNQGLFLPEYTDLVNRRLEGFEWNPELRPVKPSTSPQPKWNPIPGEPPFVLPWRFSDYLKNNK